VFVDLAVEGTERLCPLTFCLCGKYMEIKQENNVHETDDKVLILETHTVSRGTQTGLNKTEYFRIYLHLVGSVLVVADYRLYCRSEVIQACKV
jgi:hypothetical protein